MEHYQVSTEMSQEKAQSRFHAFLGGGHISSTVVRIIMIAILAVMCMLVLTANAQVPRTISYQGVLTNGGTSANGPHIITVTLYDSIDGGTQLYQESHQLTMTNGIFEMEIGSISPLPPTLTFDVPYYLGVSIDGSAELSPRVPLDAAPYALNAGTAQLAEGLTADAHGVVTSINELAGPIRLTGDSITTVTENGNEITIHARAAASAGIQSITSPDKSIAIANGTGPNTSVGVADSAITTAKLANAAVTPQKLAQAGATKGQILKWNGNAWAVANDSTGSASYIAGQGISISGNTISATGGLPAGTVLNSTLRWNGTSWIENTNMTSDASGNTHIDGTTNLGDGMGADNITMSPGTGQIQVNGWSAGVIVSNATGVLSPSQLTGGAGISITQNAGAITIADTGSVGWTLTGNTGTSAPTNFLGTIDNQPFEIHINNSDGAGHGSRRVLRFEPNATSANIIAGYQGNATSASVVGATIAGGGLNGFNNTVTDDFGVVGGGSLNRAGNNSGSNQDASHATVAGGGGNTASGIYSSILGGTGNTASGNSASVDGGSSNQATGAFATVTGGIANLANDTVAVVGGGGNTAGKYSTIPGGINLKLGANSFGVNVNGNGTTIDLSAQQNLAYFGDMDLWLGNVDNSASAIRFYAPGSSVNYSGRPYSAFLAGSQSATINYTLPIVQPSANQVLTATNITGTGPYNVTMGWTTPSGSGSAWNLTGNSGTTAGTNFLGTTDNVDLQFRADNTQAGLIQVSSTVGNTAFGFGVLELNSTGVWNTASGYSALYSNTTGGSNIAYGGWSLYSNTTGSDNAAIGVYALNHNTSGGSNIAIGIYSLTDNTTGSFNTASGIESLESNTTGYNNTANGTGSLMTNTTGYQNSAIGINSLEFNTMGYNNTANGNLSLSSNTTGNSNTGLGYLSNVVSGALTNATAIGSNAEAGESNTLILGSINNVNGATADVSVGIGTTTPQQKFNIENGNVLLSRTGANADALQFQGTSTGISSFAAGAQGATTINYTLPTAQPTANQVLAATAISGAGPYAVTLGWASGGSGSAWNLTGNSGTTPGTNFIGTTDNNDFVIKTNSNEIMRVTSSGFVGIGTSSPIDLLNVVSTTGGNAAQLENNNSTTGLDQQAALVVTNLTTNSALTEIAFGHGNSGGGVFGGATIDMIPVSLTPGSETGSLIFGTNNSGGSSVTEKMRLTYNGNLGIGTTSPQQKLEVANGNALLSRTGANAADTLQFQGTSTGISSFAAGAQGATTINYTLPTAQPTANQVLAATAIAGSGPYAVTLGWASGGSGSAWNLTGNSGTADGTNFLGTTDNVPFTIRVNDVATLRIQTGTIGPSVIAGINNYIPSSTSNSFIASGLNNGIDANESFIGGGFLDSIGSGAAFSGILGGESNFITGGWYNVIGGGYLDTIATADYSVIEGGGGNQITGSNYGFIGGGGNNKVQASNGAIVGGGNNVAYSSSFVGGGVGNFAGITVSGHTYGPAAVIGGWQDTSYATASAIVAGHLGEVDTMAFASAIIGGQNNYVGDSDAIVAGGTSGTISSGGSYSALIAGFGNSISNQGSAILGGESNSISGDLSMIGGGYLDTITGTYDGFVGGGAYNVVKDENGAIAGGELNTAYLNAFVGGGIANLAGASSHSGSAVLGGEHNTVTGDNSIIAGGQDNQIPIGAIYSGVLAGVSNYAGGSNSAIIGGGYLRMTGDNSFGFHAGSSSTDSAVIATANTAYFGNVNLWLGNTNNTASQLRFYGAQNGGINFPGASTHYSSFAAAGQLADINYTLPSTQPSANQVLTATAISGAGPYAVTLGWAAASGSTAWNLTGNSGTTAGTNFLGTTDAVDLQFRVNNQQAGLIEHGSGSGNTGLGYQVLNSNSGTYNTASGYQALYSNTTGSYNTASGAEALYYNTTGYWNTASGAEALAYNTTGYYNTASGAEALVYNTTGYYNTASGVWVLNSNTTGYSNTASGFQALYLNTTGYVNTASGTYALYSNTTGNYNTGSGGLGLYYNTTGSQNTASGVDALYSNSTGSYNTALGYYADVASGALTNATAIGANAYVGQSNSIVLGSISGVHGATGSTYVGIGTTTPAYPLHSVYSGTTDEITAIYGNATGSTTNQAIGVWGDASNTTTTNTGTIGVLATGNGNTTEGQTNVALQINDGEFAMGRTSEAPGTGTDVEAATGGTAYTQQGPSGIVELTLGAAGNLVTTAPASGTIQDLGAVTINNRYCETGSIVLVNVVGMIDDGIAPNPQNAAWIVNADNTTGGSFVVRIKMIPTATSASNYSTSDKVRIGYMIVNKSK